MVNKSSRKVLRTRCSVITSLTGQTIGSMRRETQTKNAEWSRFYHDRQLHDLEVLHAHFVDHRYARHTHDYFVIGLVESGAAYYWYRGAQQVASSSQV
jgi:AraC-like ligand binding domain